MAVLKMLLGIEIHSSSDTLPRFKGYSVKSVDLIGLYRCWDQGGVVPVECNWIDLDMAGLDTEYRQQQPQAWGSLMIQRIAN